MTISTVSKNQPMREGEIATIDALNNCINKLNNIGKILYNGSWNSGDITVNGLSDYSLFAVQLANEASYCIVYSPPTWTSFVGGNLDVNTTPNFFALSVRALRSGNKLTFKKAGYINVAGTTIVDEAVSKIIGII